MTLLSDTTFFGHAVTEGSNKNKPNMTYFEVPNLNKADFAHSSSVSLWYHKVTDALRYDYHDHVYHWQRDLDRCHVESSQAIGRHTAMISWALVMSDDDQAKLNDPFAYTKELADHFLNSDALRLQVTMDEITASFPANSRKSFTRAMERYDQLGSWLAGNPVVYFGKHIEAEMPLEAGLRNMAVTNWHLEHIEAVEKQQDRLGDPTFRSAATKLAKAFKRYRERYLRVAEAHDIRSGVMETMILELPHQKGTPYEGSNHRFKIKMHHQQVEPAITKVTLEKGHRALSRKSLAYNLENDISKAGAHAVLKKTQADSWQKAMDATATRGKRETYLCESLMAEALLYELF